MALAGNTLFVARVEELLQRLEAGDPAAGAELHSELYDELRRIAVGQMGSWERGHTLQATALVHEAWLKLEGSEALDPSGINGHAHFLRLAARAMRQVLVDHARAKGTEKRGGAGARVTLAGLGDSDESDMSESKSDSGESESE